MSAPPYGLSGFELEQVLQSTAAGEVPRSQTLGRYRRARDAVKFARAAQFAYAPANQLDWDADGAPDFEWWTGTNKVPNPKQDSFFTSGLYAIALRRISPTANNDRVELLVAFRGSEKSFADWANNVEAIAFEDTQLAQARAWLKDFLALNADKSAAISLTGHSLGGRLAATLAAEFGLPAYVFNAAGTNRALAALRDLRKSALITSVVSANDPLRNATNAFNTLTLNSGPLVSLDLGDQLRFQFCGPKQGHDIGDLVLRLQNVARVSADILIEQSRRRCSTVLGTCANNGAAPDLRVVTLFRDDFEKYVLGKFPAAGGWFIRRGAQGLGESHQQITTGGRASSKAFILVSSGYVGAQIQKLVPLPFRALALEAQVYVYDFERRNAVVGFGAVDDICAAVELMADGKVATFTSSGRDFIEGANYSARTWVTLRVELAPGANTYSVLKDGTPIAADIPVAQGCVVDRVWISADNNGLEKHIPQAVLFDDVSLMGWAN